MMDSRTTSCTLSTDSAKSNYGPAQSTTVDKTTPALEVYAAELLSISVHGHALRAPTELTISRRRDGTTSSHATLSTALLEGQQLLGAEGFVVDLAGGFDEVLEMGAGEEVA
jgi:hypothetical protein